MSSGPDETQAIVRERSWAEREAQLRAAAEYRKANSPQFRQTASQQQLYRNTTSAWPIKLMCIGLFGATIYQSYKVYQKKHFPWQQGHSLRDFPLPKGLTDMFK